MLVLFWSLSHGFTTPDTSPDCTAVRPKIRLDDSQVEMALLIRHTFESDEAVAHLADAAVANAYYESLLRPDAIAVGEGSAGLFQLHPRGAGKGMPLADRLDPLKNTNRIIEVAKHKGASHTMGLTQWQKVYWFAADVEDCERCGGPYARMHGFGDAEARHRADRLAAIVCAVEEAIGR